jgi:hypothetical protein
VLTGAYFFFGNYVVISALAALMAENLHV